MIDAVRRCWASLWADRAIAYRSRIKIDPGDVATALLADLIDGQLVTVDGTTGRITTADKVEA